MTDFIKRKHEFCKLHDKIQQLQAMLNVVNDNCLYYKEILSKTRGQLISVQNMINAKSEVPDMETVEESWDRLANAIIDKLNDIK